MTPAEPQLPLEVAVVGSSPTEFPVPRDQSIRGSTVFGTRDSPQSEIAAGGK